MKDTNSRVVIRALAVLLVSFVAVLLSTDHSLNPYDEGVILTGAMRVGEGAIPHRDFYANYGPGQFYLLAALFRLFHQGVLVERLWGALIKAALALSVLIVGRRLVSTRAAIFCCAVSVAWLCYVDNTIWPAWTALALSLLSLLPLLDMFEGRRSHFAMIAAGASLGLATLFRYDIGFLVMCAELAALAAYSFSNRSTKSPSLRHTILPTALFLGGLCLVCVPLGLAYVITGTLRDFVFDVLVFPAHFYAQTRSLPFPLPLSASEPVSAAEYVVYFPPLACAAGLLSMVTRRNAAGSNIAAAGVGRVEPFPWKLLLLILVTLAFFAKSLVRVSAIHVTLATVPATIVLASSLANIKYKRNAVVAASVFAAFALGIPTLVAVADVGQRIANNMDWTIRYSGIELSDLGSQFDIGSCRMAVGFEHLACSRVRSDEINAAKYVRARSKPGDTIFVGLPHHDRIFVNNAAFYFVVNLRPATKWYHFDPGLQTGEAVQRLIVRDLENARPKFVVLDSEWDDYREPNGSANSSGVLILDHFIEKHYRQVAKFGTMTVCELEL
jgi:Dolichyl-phosphate-mannose-protein mannosyltransferase